MGWNSHDFNTYALTRQTNGKYGVVRITPHGESTVGKDMTMANAKKKADELNRIYGK